MKFLNHDAFVEAINQWIRDGSSFVDHQHYEVGEEITLEGKDGVKETLTYYFDDGREYRDDDRPSGDPEPEDPRTPFEQAMDSLSELYRSSVQNFVMRNPGVLATYGPDFVTQLGDITVYTERDLAGPSPLDTFEILVEQKIRFSTLEYFDRQQGLKDLSLRQTPEGNLESV